MRPPLWFIDTVCPKEYDPYVLASQGLGGTEATVIRIAEALGRTQEVVVSQSKRRGTETVGKACYRPLKTQHLHDKYTGIVVLRDPKVAMNLRKFQRDTPIWLWLHDLVSHADCLYLGGLAELDINIIVVSQFHKTNLIDKMQTFGCLKYPKVTVLYNPIDDELTKDATPVDNNKLVFFSSPHKGLDYALYAFKAARNINPELKLYVANPGYMSSTHNLSVPGVVDCGVLTHAQAIQHVRSALCVFYPNYVFPETFGLVFAEANAVGTPVLTHQLGAAREVLNDDRQIIDVRGLAQLVGRVTNWQKGDRPEVSGKPEFRTKAVTEKWIAMLTKGANHVR